MIGRRRVQWISGLLAAWIALTLFLAACQSSGSNHLLVYVSLPISPGAPRIGSSLLKGIQLAFAQIDGQMIGNYKVELMVLKDDDPSMPGQWVAQKEIENAQLAVRDPLAVAYLGPLNSGAAKLSIPILNRAGMAQVAATATWPGLTKFGYAQSEPGIFYPTGQRTFYRTCPTDDLQGPAAALWAKDLDFKSVYILDDGEAYGAGIAALFARRADQIGLKNLGHQTIDKTAQDFKPVLEQVMAAKPDLVYFGGTVANGAGLVVRQMRAMGMTTAFMGPDAVLDSSLIDVAQSAAEGTYATFVGQPADRLTSAVGQKFYTDYKAMWSEEPEAFAQYGYDAAQVIIAAIRNSNPANRANVLLKIAATNDFEGATGQFSFNSDGDTTLTTVSGNVVQGGTFKFVKTLPVGQ